MNKFHFLTLALLGFANLSHAQDSTVQITSLTTATAYENHEAVGATQTFTSHDRIFVAVVVANSGEPVDVRVSFERVGSTGSSTPRGVLLNVPRSRRFRTVARTAGLPAGQYHAVVRDAEGTTLSEVQFTVSE